MIVVLYNYELMDDVLANGGRGRFHVESVSDFQCDSLAKQ